MKTIIEIWTSDDLSGIEDLGIQQVWTEIDEDGRVLREIGLGESGELAYVAPSDHSKHGRGLFDNQIVSLRAGRGDDPSLKKRFESLWVSDGPRSSSR